MRNSQSGFSLIEIMAALAILGIVVGLVAVNVTGSLTKAKIDSGKIALKNIEQAIEEYRRDCHKYPRTSEGLNVLIEKPPTCRNWKPGGYLSKQALPRDPWDNEFGYFSPPQFSQGAKFEIISYGADGVEGGEDEDADLNNNIID